MITGLPATFEAAMLEASRKPVQLIHFVTNVGTFYLSDKVVGIADGFDNDYSPWVESWGALKDSSDVSKIFQGGSLEIRSGTITLINSPESREFIQFLFSLSIENIQVELYQWFADIPAADAVLIDIMVCQDPIDISEASMLLNIEIVSMIMINNPYLWAREPGEETRNAVIGKAEGVPFVDMQTARWTKTAEEIDHTYLGTVTIDNGIGFPASGFVYIDSELLGYSWITASGINITSRGAQGTEARPHLIGAGVTIPDANYDYVICTGPVAAVDNLKGNGEPYVNPVTLLISQDPVIARFIGRPPWLKVEVNDGEDIQPPNQTLTDQYANDVQFDYEPGYSNPLNASAINQAAGAATLQLTSNLEDQNNHVVERTTFPTIIDENNTYYEGTTLPPGWQNMIARDLYGKHLGIHLTTYPNDITNSSVQGIVSIAFTGDLSVVGGSMVGGWTLRLNWGTCSVQMTSAKMAVHRLVAGVVGLWIHPWQTDYEDFTPPPGTETYTGFSDTEEEVLMDQMSLADFTNTGVQLTYEATWVRNDQTWFLFHKGEMNLNFFEFEFDYVILPYTPPEPWQELFADFDTDLTSYGALVSVKVRVKTGATSSCETEMSIQQKTGSSGSPTILQSIIPSPATEYGPFNLGITSWSVLADTRVGLFQQITGPETENARRNVTSTFEYVQWEIEYQPGVIPTPDENRVVYADTMTADVTSLLGADPTPAQVIRDMIETYSPAANLLDTVDFEARHQEYLAESYFLNGVIDGNFQLHDALRKVMFEGMARLLFNAGKIKLLTHITGSDETVDSVISLDDVLLRSRAIKNQPVSIIKNDVMVIYDQNLANESEYDGRSNYTATDSISRYMRQEQRLVYDLVHSDSVAQTIGYTNLDGFKQPVSLTYFRCFIPAGYVLEKGDRISIQSFVNPAETVTGNIVAITRNFGKGKNKQMNVYDIAILNFIPESAVADGYGGAGYGSTPYGD